MSNPFKYIVKNLTLVFVLTFFFTTINAQVQFDRSLLDASGQLSSVSWGTVSYSIGEPVVFTGDGSSFNFWLTQGFQQPDGLQTFSVLSVAATVVSVSCVGNNDGSAIAFASGGTAPYTYNWSDGQVTSKADNLVAGTYSVQVTDSLGAIAAYNVIVSEENVKCGEIKIYKGLTPNGDGQNEYWRITGIEQFSSEIEVFNRWGGFCMERKKL